MSNVRSTRLSRSYSLKARLDAGLFAAWALAVAVAGVLYFTTRTSVENARIAAGADDEGLKLLSFAVAAHRFVDACGHAVGEGPPEDPAKRADAEQRFRAELAGLSSGVYGTAAPEPEWAQFHTASERLVEQLDAVHRLRVEGNAQAARRLFDEAVRTTFEQAMLPWFDHARDYQRQYASALESKSIDRTRLLSTLGAASAAVFAVLMTFAIRATQRALTRPIRLLVDGTDAIARGDYRHRIDYQSRDELGLLAQRFNGMAAMIESSQQLLLDKNRALEESYQLQGEFLSTMSHELRSPLHSIIGYTELVLDDLPSAPGDAAQKNVQSITTSAQRLLAIIDDILDFSKLKAGRMTFRVERFALERLAEDVAADARMLAQHRDIAIRVDLGPDIKISEMVSDPIKVRQILTNLMSNAVKFCERGSVTLRVARQSDDRVLFQVIDTGIGIAERHLQRIFEPFRQVQAHATQAVGATGLGLAIVSRLCALLGGTVTVKSNLGVGSEFSVYLPINAEGLHGQHTHTGR